LAKATASSAQATSKTARIVLIILRRPLLATSRLCTGELPLHFQYVSIIAI